MNANPYLAIESTNAGIIKLGKTGNLICICGNAGNDTLAAGSLELTISTGINTRIVSVSKVKKSNWKAWKVKSLSKEKVGNTIKLINTGKFQPFDLSQIILNVKGEKKTGTFQTVTGNVTTVLGIDPETGNQYIAQGNATSVDDNSTTSFTVV